MKGLRAHVFVPLTEAIPKSPQTTETARQTYKQREKERERDRHRVQERERERQRETVSMRVVY